MAISGHGARPGRSTLADGVRERREERFARNRAGRGVARPPLHVGAGRRLGGPAPVVATQGHFAPAG